MLNRLITFISPARDARPAPQSPTPVAPIGQPTAFSAPQRANVATATATGQQQLLSLALENLSYSASKLSADDMTAALIDLFRVARKAGKTSSDLINAPDPSGQRILDHLASSAIDAKEKLKVLVSMGCHIEGTNPSGDNAMHAAARYNNNKLIEELALKAGSLTTSPTARAKTYIDATPLAVAIVYGHSEIVRQLLRCGASLTDPCCRDADRTTLTPQELYARLDIRTPDMSKALRTGRAYK